MYDKISAGKDFRNIMPIIGKLNKKETKISEYFGEEFCVYHTC